MLLYISETPDLHQSLTVFLIIVNQWKQTQNFENLHITHIHGNKLIKTNRNLTQMSGGIIKMLMLKRLERQCLLIVSPIAFLYYMHQDVETKASAGAPLTKTKKTPYLSVLVSLSF